MSESPQRMARVDIERKSISSENAFSETEESPGSCKITAAKLGRM